MSLTRFRESTSQAGIFVWPPMSGTRRAISSALHVAAALPQGAADYSAARMSTDTGCAGWSCRWLRTPSSVVHARRQAVPFLRRRPRDPSHAPSAQDGACHGLGTAALAEDPFCGALRAFRIWLSVAPSCQRERELQRSYSFAGSGLLGGGPGGWRRLHCRRLEWKPSQDA